MRAKWIKKKINRKWTLITFVRDNYSWRGAEIQISASCGGEVIDGKETPYVRHKLINFWWTTAKYARNRIEVEIRVSNGESTGVWFDLAIPFVGAVHLKIHAPSKLIKPWVLDSRSFGITLGWLHVFDVRVGYEGDSMRSYYLRKIKAGEPRPKYVGRFALIRGFRFGLSLNTAKKWLFGKPSCNVEKTKGGTVAVPMPEGIYSAEWTRERRTWRRSRIPWALKSRDDIRLDIKPGIPVPGKGENSWDIDDDAIYGTGGSTVAGAIGNAVKSATRSRLNYAGPNWKPDAGWPDLSEAQFNARVGKHD